MYIYQNMFFFIKTSIFFNKKLKTIINKVVELVDGGSVINRATPSSLVTNHSTQQNN